MALNKSRSSANLQSITRAALFTLLIYVAVNLIALGWGLLTLEEDSSFRIQLAQLVVTINGEVQGLSWREDSTRIILISIFMVMVLRDIWRGRATLQREE